ncbi:MAG: ribonuclease III [Bacteroidota bacterium]|nr:ribonuclease III [Candidatus Kapabacteria bacterium]MCS7301999.1 ribonuclease III [Candidatus Kapabacteria bacterium]MCX7936799.1 ribonuclease III [Chlorobiota bacterium]MDW8074518.1 ribonuclease III [Bacteroidota bacterium]MDW8271006.1 ribonuclease III [Bacteroidota bacterium]
MRSFRPTEKSVTDIVRSLYSGLVRFTMRRVETLRRKAKRPVEHIVGDRRAALEQALGVTIAQPYLYEEALTHRSYLQVKNDPAIQSNERLEFLGDAILGMVIAEYLFHHHEDVAEGELTKMRSWLVNKRSLAICARKLQLDRFMLMSYSAANALARGSDSVLADAVEALIAAVYLDRGFDAARRFIEERLLPLMLEERVMHDTNFKSLLLEHVQARGYSAPRYHVIEERGPDHEKQFTVAVYVGSTSVGIGTGRNKKEAEQNAARQALEYLKSRITPTTDPEEYLR